MVQGPWQPTGKSEAFTQHELPWEGVVLQVRARSDLWDLSLAPQAMVSALAGGMHW